MYYESLIQFIKNTSMENSDDLIYCYQKYKKYKYKFRGQEYPDYRKHFVFKYDADLR